METPSSSDGSQYCLVKKGSHKGREVAVGTEPPPPASTTTITTSSLKQAASISSSPKRDIILAENEIRPEEASLEPNRGELIQLFKGIVKCCQGESIRCPSSI